MILVFDTETTGKADFRSPANDPRQPHLVQLGAQLLDDKLTVRSELNRIIKPNGWIIPKEASDVHGITQEIAEQYGFDLLDVAGEFYRMATRAKVMVCHNFDFDELIVSAQMHRLDYDGDWWLADEVVRFCTMKHMTDVCAIPGPYGFKWPRLQEAFQYCFKREFDGAHDAMADVRACADIYRWIVNQTKLLSNQ